MVKIIQCNTSILNFLLVGTINDNPEQLELRLYVDADFAGDCLSGKSTSGGFLTLHGPNTFFPIAWVSKRETSAARSTTESKVVSLAHSLYQEGLPALQLWKINKALPPPQWDSTLRLLGTRIGLPSELKRSYGRGRALAPRVVAVGVSMSGTG